MKFKEMTNKELENFIEETYDIIYGNNSCYNCKDLINLDNALVEANNRNLKKITKKYEKN